jgi:Flp pilus assembly protein TadD
LLVQQALLLHRLEKYPNDFPALLHLGTVMLSRLNPGGAMSMLQAAVKVDPQSPEAHNFLGSALASRGRTQEAIGQFRLALSLRPKYPNARFNLGTFWSNPANWTRRLRSTSGVQEDPGDESGRRIDERSAERGP